MIILSQPDIKQSITMHQAIDAMELAFKELAQGNAILPLRTPVAVKNEDALMLAMPAYLQGQGALGLKVVSVFPHNSARDKPTINGVILLINEQTGEAKALMEAGYLTALRTGAVSGLATKYLAPKDASHLCIIGSGPQAITQLEAVVAVRPIKSVSIWSRNYKNAQAFAQQIKGDFELHCHQDLARAVRDADVICTATSSTEPLIQLKDLKEEVHINAVGAHNHQMCEISSAVLADALVVVDQQEAALAEAGDIHAALVDGSITKDDLIDLGLVISKEPLVYKRSVFKSVGLAIQDLAIAQKVYHNAVHNNLGKHVSLS